MPNISTVFGNAQLYNDGYYHITSRENGNHGKLLHRLIWEKAWGKLPKGWVVHHLDGDKTNNCLLNLYGMPEHSHRVFHTKGQNNHFYGKQHSEETLEKMRKNHARIIKLGFDRNNNQRYGIKNNKGKRLKQSIYPQKLINWFLTNYPLEIINTEIPQ